MWVRLQTETIETEAEKIAMTWSDIGDPIILHNRAPSCLNPPKPLLPLMQSFALRG